jgi:hypothetical protein
MRSVEQILARLRETLPQQGRLLRWAAADISRRFGSQRNFRLPPE